MQRRFDPWIGPQYREGIRGRRLLLVGDSHYADQGETHFARSFTQDIVRCHAIERPATFFEHLRLTASGLSKPLPAREFWERVSFVNLVQDVMQQSNTPPTADQFGKGWLALRQSVSDLKPDLMLVYSMRAWNADVPQSQSIDPEAGAYRPLAPDLQGLGAYPRVGLPPLVASALNHPRASGTTRSVWRVWTERGWQFAGELAESRPLP